MVLGTFTFQVDSNHLFIFILLATFYGQSVQTHFILIVLGTLNDWIHSNTHFIASVLNTFKVKSIKTPFQF